jgi:hypothetical protein
MGTEYRDEFTWAAAWSNGSPRPFILTSTVNSLRSKIVEDIGSIFKRDGETARQGWKRAYRMGCRIIRVRVSYTLASEEKP